MWKYSIVFIGVYFCSISSALAVECTAIFPTTIASSNSTSTITLNNGSNILNAPGSQLTTQNLVQNDPSPCGSSACSASNSIAEQIPVFNSFSGGSNLSVGYKKNLNVSPGHYGSLTGVLNQKYAFLRAITILMGM